ncbi:hypothetical protein F5880DRAFT_121368 [Lentinula raphanica]|nr:hypothetical protein F5880DRAFT_121368 [Lentinula raphanica]
MLAVECRCKFADVPFSLYSTTIIMAWIRQRKPNPEPPKSDATPLIDIPEDEQWRLINESGVLHKISSDEAPTDSEYTSMDEILDTSMIIIPFCSLLLLMDILIHNQYGRQASFKELFHGTSSRGPILALFNGSLIDSSS